MKSWTYNITLWHPAASISRLLRPGKVNPSFNTATCTGLSHPTRQLCVSYVTTRPWSPERMLQLIITRVSWPPIDDDSWSPHVFSSIWWYRSTPCGQSCHETALAQNNCYQYIYQVCILMLSGLRETFNKGRYQVLLPA